jgi:hypothetical protein
MIAGATGIQGNKVTLVLLELMVQMVLMVAAQPGIQKKGNKVILELPQY